ncbi:MAG: tRNA (N6-isopentenyl adenosine(37)-C2)-methylthiotransferase MiaB [Thermodesulfovibrionales bacterium]|nr:tRNA (N6-isopentenyl adenosine(37)-C2)-methylthiotransferase MiaB [Thermodesulfovibrionales bacterium]
MTAKKAYIHTFGCQMNMHDSEKMAGILLNEGYTLTDAPQDADLIVFNTCSIRQKAEQKFRSELGRTKSLKKKNPFLRIAVAGCIAQQQGRGIIKNNPQVDYVFGPQNLQRLGDMIRTGESVVLTEDNPEISDSDLPVLRKDGIRAWVSIMYGCNNFCSYCVVPYTRGREKSRPARSIYEEIRKLASAGFKEVTLLGQNVNSYKSEIDFGGLLKQIDAIEGIERIRFVTSHPRDLSEDLMGCIKELPKVCEHIHLPLQSGSSRILKLMNRGYTYEDYMRKADKLIKEIPGIAITTDIITGFPSEAVDDHASTIMALRAVEFDGIFAFKFSSRPGTKAAVMDEKVPDFVKSQRLAEILQLQDEITLKKNKALEGTIQEVLIEGASKADKGKITGRTRTNKIVNFSRGNVSPGQIADVRIVKAMRHSLEGELI